MGVRKVVTRVCFCAASGNPCAGCCGGCGWSAANTAGAASGSAVSVPCVLLQAGMGGIAAGRVEQIQLSLTGELPF